MNERNGRNVEILIVVVRLSCLLDGRYMRNGTYGFVAGPRPTVASLTDGVEWLMENPVRINAAYIAGVCFSSTLCCVATDFQFLK